MSLAPATIAALLGPFDRPGAPGAALLIVEGGAIVHRSGYGCAAVEDGTPATPATSFRLASVSKQFTALLILQLAERGRVHLDNRIGRHIDGLPDYAEAITLRQLLSHTAGLPDYEASIPPETTAQLRDADVPELLRAAPGPLFVPGSAYRYSNTGYCLLALIAERVSGLAFPDLLSREIAGPLDMRHTLAYVAGGPEIPRRAFGYTVGPGGVARTDQSLTSATLGDGGMYASADDLARWDTALSTDQLATAATRALMFTPWVAAPHTGSHYGFGWFLRRSGGHLVAWHDGETTGFRNAIERCPARRAAVILLSNRSDSAAPQIARRIMDALLGGA